SLAGLQALARLCDPLQEAWIVLQLVVEPIVFRSKPHQDACRLPVPGDDDLLVLRQAEVLRQVIFDFRQSYLLHRSPHAPKAMPQPRISARSPRPGPPLRSHRKTPECPHLREAGTADATNLAVV